MPPTATSGKESMAVVVVGGAEEEEGGGVMVVVGSRDDGIYGVRLEGAFPVTVSSINLDNNSENTIQKLNVTLSYENYVPEDIVDTIKSSVGIAGAALGI